MLQITAHERTYLLAAGTSMDELKQAVLTALREAPAFLSLRTATGGQVEVAITATASVVLEERDEPAGPVSAAEDSPESDYDDLYGMDFL